MVLVALLAVLAGSLWAAVALAAPPAKSPDFSLSVSSAAPLYPGEATVFTVTMSPLNGFSGSVNLSVSGLPTSTAGTFVTNPLSPSKSSTSMIVEAGSSVPLGNYTLTITGTSGSVTHTTTASLVVASPTTFTLDETPTVNNVAAGTAATYTMKINRLNGFAGSVTLATNFDLPPGVTASFNPNPASATSSILTLQTSATTPQGSYPFAIQGTSGKSSTWIRATLNVGSFSLSASPSTRTIGRGSSTTYNLSVSRSFFTANVTLSVAGLPTGATASFSPNPVLGPSGSSSTLTVQTSSTVQQGTYTLTITGTGGSPAQTKTTQVTLVVDTTPPATTISFPSNAGAYNSVGWFGKCVSGIVTGICGAASDNASGVASVKVAIRNGLNQYWNGSGFVVSSTPIFNAATGTTSWSYSFTPPADGPYTALVQATDGVGNTTAAGTETSVTFKYDTTPPATTLATIPSTPDGSNGWFKRASVQFTLTADDATSGVQASFYKLDGGATQTYTGAVTITTQGDHTVSYWSTDNAGNTETAKTAHVKLDNVAPSTTITINPANPNGLNGWYSSAPSFTLAAADATSGPATSFYRIDNGPQQTYAGVAVTIPDGQHTINYWSTDNAGNAETAKSSGPVKIDTVKPSTTFAIDPPSPNGSNGFYSGGAPIFTLTGGDGTSGVAHSYYRIDNGSPQTYPDSPVAIPDGQHRISYWSTDNAGNTETAKTAGPFKVDTTPPPAPSITAHPGDPSNQPTAHFEFTDSEPGVDLLCKLDGGSYVLCTSPHNFSGLGQGSHSFSVEARDPAGNTSATGFNWTIQAQPYTIGVEPIASLYPGGPASKINLTFANPNGDTIKVSSLAVSVSSVTGGSNTPNACTPADYQVTQFTGAYPFYIPTGSSSLQSMGFAAGNWPTLRMLDNGNQDGCKGATVHLSFGGNS